ncbi:hypothetical protein BFP70_10180 [Thioclava sp. SK-1]|nr:hypothetical protein BFP70_10180 [Thioclava sp. SK-1]
MISPLLQPAARTDRKVILADGAAEKALSEEIGVLPVDLMRRLVAERRGVSGGQCREALDLVEIAGVNRPEFVGDHQLK